MPKPVILSGIRPSGLLHIGNYLGALKQWVDLQDRYRLFAMIADLHAITTPFDPQELSEATLATAVFYLASGIDPQKSIIFVQSHVPAHTELGWILNTITPIGELERMTQFKEKKEEAGTPAGLLNYPVLQAADVLLYQTDVVPIGKDQLQHIEFTRTLARKFNNRFGKVFKEPRAIVPKETERVMGLDDPKKKMSKSAASPNNYISLLDPPEEIRRKIKIAVTDSGKEVRCDERNKPAISNLMIIYGAFSGLSLAAIEKQYVDKGYAEFKNDLARLLVENLAPIQKKYQELIKDKKTVLKTLKQGAEQANKVARNTLATVKKKVGLLTEN